MAGYSVDPEALEGAIKELEDVRSKIEDLATQARQVKPGELTAQDTYTNKARQIIHDRASGDSGSLRAECDGLRAKLQEKIDAYRETLQQYQSADQAAADDANRIDSRA